MADFYVERMIYRKPRKPMPNNAKCKFCGEDILWGLDKGKWFPYDWDGNNHDCRDKTDEFERN